MADSPSNITAAAVQLEAEVGNLDANLTMCEELAGDAAAAGADWILLPEFFSSGVGYRMEINENAPPADGEPTRLLRDLARRHSAHVGGSAIVRDSDGHCRNAFFLCSPDGEILGRHDKDLPTMWESALYIGGGDPGRIEAPDAGLTAGVALCWELMRTQTVERLVSRVDLVVGGSGWWSIPPWPPRNLFGALQAANRRRAVAAAPNFAAFVGAPVVHAAHSGTVNCPLPMTGAIYHGHFQGGASISDERGNLLAIRQREEGPGFALAELTPKRVPDPYPYPEQSFWLQERGALAALLWGYQNIHGRWVYGRRGHRHPDGGGDAIGAVGANVLDRVRDLVG